VLFDVLEEFSEDRALGDRLRGVAGLDELGAEPGLVDT
jgi:hypothetical protein